MEVDLATSSISSSSSSTRRSSCCSSFSRSRSFGSSSGAATSRFRFCRSVVQGHAAPADEKRPEEVSFIRCAKRGPIFSLPAEDGSGRPFGLEFELELDFVVSFTFFFLFALFLFRLVPGKQPAADPGRLSVRSLSTGGREREKRFQGPRSSLVVLFPVADAKNPFCRRRRRRAGPARRRAVRLGAGGSNR